MRHLRPVAIYAGVISFFINLLILPMSLYSLQVYDRVMSTGSMATLLWLTVLMIFVFAAAGVLQSLRHQVMSRASDWIYHCIAEATIPLSLTHLAHAPGARNIQSLRDAASIRQFLGGAALTAILDAPWAVLSILILFIIHFWLGILVLLGSAVLMLSAWVNERSTHAGLKQVGTAQMKSMNDIEVAARNTDVVEAMGMGGTIVGRWRQNQQESAPIAEDVNRRIAVIQGVTKFLRLSLQILVTAVSAWLALHNQVTMGAIIAASILSSRAFGPFEAAIASWKSVIEARDAYDRLKKILVTQPRAEDIALPRPEGRVTVEGVYYAPPQLQQQQAKPILRNVSFQLAPGEMLGIIGPSGSGKTTLARLITGTWRANAGVVRLDEADVYQWPRASFGQYVGYMPQDVELFSGTVRDNIARLNPDAKDEDIIAAAQLAGAHELILRLPKGYSTDIGVQGEYLSAGQRQRVGLARAFYGSPRLLVLDEPDSNLDDAGQVALAQALQMARSYGMTTIIISHRRTVLQHVDKILYLREGAVELFGPAAEVVAKLSAAASQTEGGR